MTAPISTRFCRLFKLLNIHRHTTVSVGHRAVGTNPSHWQSASRQSEKSWQLWSAVCLERLPVITQPMNSLEEDFLALQKQVEHENSYLSEHELRHREDLLRAERVKKSEDLDDTDMDATRQTSVDLEDMWEAELNKFTPADRLTDADRENDCKSLQRKLDRKLILVVKQKLGKEAVWVLPKRKWVEGESMRQTAERVLKCNSGESLTATFLGNAPCGVYRYKFPQAIQNQTDSTGLKIFFFKARFQNGKIKTSEDTEDHLWLTKDELKDYLTPAYYKSVEDFILEL